MFGQFKNTQDVREISENREANCKFGFLNLSNNVRGDFVMIRYKSHDFIRNVLQSLKLDPKLSYKKFLSLRKLLT